MSDRRMENAADTAKELAEVRYALQEHESLNQVDIRVVESNALNLTNSWILLRSLWRKYPNTAAGTYDANLRKRRQAPGGDMPLPEHFTDARQVVQERPRLIDKFDEIEAGMIQIMSDIVKGVTPKNREYNESWYKRGGVGAYMMLARKIDRLENYVQAHGFDIMKALAADTRPEGIVDDIQDLIGYLGLVLQKRKFGGL